MPTATSGNPSVEADPRPDAAAASAPPSVLEVLKAFQETQQRRVAHWQEYDEALNAFMAQQSNGGAGAAAAARAPVGGSKNDAGEIRSGPSDAEGEGDSSRAAEGHRCCGGGHGAGGSTGGTSPQDGGPTPLTEELMTRILGLVTSGLLDCGHTTRALSSELKSGNAHFAPRPELAKMLGDVQELENRLLRGVVKRDQARRRERVEGRDLEDEIREAQRDVDQCKREIGEAMDEVSAEVADLAAAE